MALKDEVDKIVIAKLVNVPTSLNNLKRKVDNLDVGKLITIPEDLKKPSYVVYNTVVKSTELNTLKTKVNKFDNKVSNSATYTDKSIQNT